jgi:acetylornithine deacetylase/succinyl-diaminopimelate desuccinylase-like protein
LCGATGGGAHGIDEWAELSSVTQLVAVLDNTARRFGAGAE